MRCFTQCCAGLNLTLTPYDIVRLKNRLGLSSDQFLDNHAETRLDKHPRFPMVTLKMQPDPEKKCPFVTAEGCTVYEDRPSACRIYPLGRAALKVDSKRGAKEKFFMVHEEHCLGFGEDRLWTVEEWLADQGVHHYNIMNDGWLEVITSPKSLGPEKDIQRKIQMFFMASYNLDKYRQFLFESKFFALFQVDPEQQKRLGSDDVALMAFAFDWLKFSLFGERTLSIKSEGVSPGMAVP
ncbi:MAG: YkgJ family cysteine cluster protein [Deltaproteobacteria bacterium]